jgi:hypothetical protein
MYWAVNGSTLNMQHGVCVMCNRLAAGWPLGDGDVFSIWHLDASRLLRRQLVPCGEGGALAPGPIPCCVHTAVKPACQLGQLHVAAGRGRKLVPAGLPYERAPTFTSCYQRLTAVNSGYQLL